MTKRRKPLVRVRVIDPPVQPIESWWSKNVLLNIGILFSILTTSVGFYYNTTSKLNEHTKTLDKLEVASKVSDDAREKVRNDFITNAAKTADGIAVLNTKTEVQNVQLQNIAVSLDKMNRLLEAVSISKH